MYVQTHRPPQFPIKSKQQFLILGLAVVVSSAIILPNYAKAFWPFSTNAGAAMNVYSPNSEVKVLSAAININPNPYKGLGDTVQTSGGKALLAYVGPSGTISDVADKTPPDTISVYVVRDDPSDPDTLSEIAAMFNVSVNTIVWANNLRNTKDIHPGDTLIILPISGVKKTIAKGDTLKSIAKTYNADANEIAQYNGLDLSAPLVVGSTIIIPGGEVHAPAPTPRPQSSSAPVIVGGGGSFIAGYYSNPVPGAKVTQGVHGKNGIDLGASRGTPVYASAGGSVIIARGNGAWNGGYGNYVVILHNNGTQTLYSHLNSVISYVGQTVSANQVIGYVGSTGRVTGTHLHFEVRGAANPFRNCSVGSVCSPQ